MSLLIKTAKDNNLALCPKCHKVNQVNGAGQDKKIQCVRCGGLFYQRNPRSLQYTLAWNIAALLAFIRDW